MSGASFLASPRKDGAPDKHNPWDVLIVDDEEEVHGITTMALKGLSFDGRGLRFHHAYSGGEAIECMRRTANIAVILMDVVMESEHDGLDAVRAIREELGNRFVRIILRTGQPGQAPERYVITEFDINDYKEKTELTANKLFTVIYTALGSYRDLIALDRNRQGLEKVIDASATLLEERSVHRFAQGVLEQLVALLHMHQDAVMIRSGGLAASRSVDAEPVILAGIGRYTDVTGAAAEALDEAVASRIRKAIESGETEYSDDYFLYYFRSLSGREVLLYLDHPPAVDRSGQHIIDLFCRNVGTALDNLYLNSEISTTQQELVLLLSEAIEQRSLDTGNHVLRVAEYSALLGQLRGLDREAVEVLRMAAPLHDIGKIAIPDAILNKPGRHDEREFEEMKKHAAIGARLFEGRELPVLQAARVIAAEHHENWDGSGYPAGKSGDDIHIFGRIVAIADVYDALLSVRCYKEPWPQDKTLEYLREQSGVKFDPQLIDLWFDNLDRFLEIGKQLKD